MQSQDLKKHQWRDRLIVVSSPTFDDTEANAQLEVLENAKAGLKERKLVVYHVTNSGYRQDFSSEILVSENSESEISRFNVALIGLDGTEKFHSIEVEEVSRFFNLIDKMPMRQQEIRNKN